MNITAQPSRVSTCKNNIVFKVLHENLSAGNPFIKFTLTFLGTDKEVILIGYPDGSGNVTFNLRRLIDDYFKEAYFPPADPTAIPSRGEEVNSMYVRLKFVIEEMAGSPSTSSASVTLGETDGDKYLVLAGGFAYESWPNEYYFSQWLATFTLKPFLTWKNTISLIGVDQPEWLTYFDLFYNGLSETSSEGKLKLKIIAKYNDNSTVDYTRYESTYEGPIVRFAVGLNQLNLPPVSGKFVISYKVHVLDSTLDTQVSEERSFIVDRNFYPVVKYVFFRNSLCGLDTFRLIGTGEFNADYNRSSKEVYDGQYNKLIGTSIANQVSEIGGGKFNSGYITRYEANWIRELFLSKHVFFLNNSIAIPCKVTSKKYAAPLDADLNSVTVEIDYAFENEVYTPINITV